MKLIFTFLFSFSFLSCFAQGAYKTFDDLNREALDERILERIDTRHVGAQNERKVELIYKQILSRTNLSESELRDMFGEAMIERIKSLQGGTVLPAIKVWRELALDSPANITLQSVTNSDGEKCTILDVFFQDVLNGRLNGFFEPGDTSIVPLKRIRRYKNITDTTTAFKINKLLILENWLYDNNVKSMRGFVFAIAPSYSLDEATNKPLFWMYYRDLSGAKEFTLSKLFIHRINKKDRYASLIEYFDNSFFQSRIIKIED